MELTEFHCNHNKLIHFNVTFVCRWNVWSQRFKFKVEHYFLTFNERWVDLTNFETNYVINNLCKFQDLTTTSLCQKCLNKPVFDKKNPELNILEGGPYNPYLDRKMVNKQEDTRRYEKQDLTLKSQFRLEHDTATSQKLA